MLYKYHGDPVTLEGLPWLCLKLKFSAHKAFAGWMQHRKTQCACRHTNKMCLMTRILCTVTAKRNNRGMLWKHMYTRRWQIKQHFTHTAYFKLNYAISSKESLIWLLHNDKCTGFHWGLLTLAFPFVGYAHYCEWLCSASFSELLTKQLTRQCHHQKINMWIAQKPVWLLTPSKLPGKVLNNF
jgi:hypothetical protein